MPDDKVRATDKPGIANKATPSRGTSGSGSAAASEPEPIILKVPREAGDGEVYDSLLATLGMQGVPGRSGGRSDDYFVLQKAFKSDLSDIWRDARNRSNKNVITLYFTPRGRSTRKDLRNIPNEVFKLRIQHEFQVEDERRRREDERRAEEKRREDERRATAARLARERESQALDSKIAQEVQNIIKQVMWWEEGTLHGFYSNGQFITIPHYPWTEHKDSIRAKAVYNSASHRHRIGQALREAYHAPGKSRIIYQIPVPSRAADDTATKAAAPTPPTQASTSQDYIAGLVGHKRGIAGQMIQEVKEAGDKGAAVLEAVNPADPVNLATAGGAGVVLKGAAYGVKGLAKSARFGTKVAKAKRVLNLLKNKGLKEQPLSDYFKRQDYGKYQIAQAGGSEIEYLGLLSNGKKVQIDNLADSVTEAGKLDIIEMKFGNPYIDIKNIERSGHLQYADSKADQMYRLARYAHENPDEIARVKILCSNQTVSEVYLNIVHQDVPQYLQKYIDVLDEEMNIVKGLSRVR